MNEARKERWQDKNLIGNFAKKCGQSLWIFSLSGDSFSSPAECVRALLKQCNIHTISSSWRLAVFVHNSGPSYYNENYAWTSGISQRNDNAEFCSKQPPEGCKRGRPLASQPQSRWGPIPGGWFGKFFLIAVRGFVPIPRSRKLVTRYIQTIQICKHSFFHSFGLSLPCSFGLRLHLKCSL